MSTFCFSVPSHPLLDPIEYGGEPLFVGHLVLIENGVRIIQTRPPQYAAPQCAAPHAYVPPHPDYERVKRYLTAQGAL